MTVEGSLPEAGGLERIDAGAAHSAVQKTGNGQCLIADGFGLETESRGSPEPTIGGVDVESLGCHAGGLSVGVRGDDGLQKGLDVPVGTGEFSCQPVEKHGMAGRLSLCAEVFFG